MKMEELLKDPSFVEKLRGVQSIADIQRLFAEEGVTVTPEELMQLALPEAEGDELSETDLENVSGGSSVLSWLLSRLSGRFSGGSGGNMGGR